MPSSADSSITVTAYGTIDSGSALVSTGNPPAGILAGYLGGSVIPSSPPLTSVNGDVTVNSYADITAAAGDGIRAYNYGIGDVTVNDDAGTITAPGGTSPANGFGNGIAAYNFGTGDTSVTTAAGVVIHSGASGIDANDGAAAAPSTSEVYVLAYGTITSGTIPTSDGNPAAGILAGYNYNSAVDNNADGNVVIDDYASITAAAGTDGIRGYNYGTGTVTITAEAGADITAGRYGIAAVGKDGGDVSITNDATVSAATAIYAMTGGTGTATIDNYGTITGAVTSYNATFTNESGAVWNLTGSSYSPAPARSKISEPSTPPARAASRLGTSHADADQRFKRRHRRNRGHADPRHRQHHRQCRPAGSHGNRHAADRRQRQQQRHAGGQWRYAGDWRPRRHQRRRDGYDHGWRAGRFRRDLDADA